MVARAVIAVVAVLTVAGNIALGWSWRVALAAGVAVVVVGELAGWLAARRGPRRPGIQPVLGDHAPLTAREAEVAVLVAHGLANKVVARRLGIREKTADRHLENINKKLDIHTRVQLTNWVRDRGLLEGVPAAREASPAADI